MDRQLDAQPFDDGLGRGHGQCRAIALPAQVQLDEPLKVLPDRTAQQLVQEFGGLLVGKMPIVAQNAGDQQRMPAAGALHFHIVVEFESQEVHVTKRRDEPIVPRAKVGRVAERPRGLGRLADPPETETEGRPAVVPQRERKTADRFAADELVVRISPQQSARLKPLDEPVGTFGAQLDQMLAVAVEWDLLGQQRPQRADIPMIGVRVGQKRSMDVLP